MTPAAGSIFRGTSLIDAHVHFHAFFDRFRFLAIAAKNFSSAALELRLQQPYLGWLLFTESYGERYFDQFRREAGGTDLGGWSIQRTAESRSLVAKSRQGEQIVLVAGRQIITAEGLEVLGLGLENGLPDGAPLEQCLDAITELRSIPVLPWGFGKWWFGRGRVMDDLLRRNDQHEFYLGDNSGRPRFTPEPKAFTLARSKGVFVLPGSDPLPLAGGISKIGGFGFRMDAPIDMTTPFLALHEALNRCAAQPSAYGQGENMLRFLRNQLAMQLRKLWSGDVRRSYHQAPKPHDLIE